VPTHVANIQINLEQALFQWQSTYFDTKITQQQGASQWTIGSVCLEHHITVMIKTDQQVSHVMNFMNSLFHSQQFTFVEMVHKAQICISDEEIHSVGTINNVKTSM